MMMMHSVLVQKHSSSTRSRRTAAAATAAAAAAHCRSTTPHLAEAVAAAQKPFKRFTTLAPHHINIHHIIYTLLPLYSVHSKVVTKYKSTRFVLTDLTREGPAEPAIGIIVLAGYGSAGE